MTDHEVFLAELARRKANPATFEKPEVFYHIACMNAWQPVVTEQLKLLKGVGLGDKVTACIVGDDPEGEAKCLAIAAQWGVNLQSVPLEDRSRWRFEEPTLSALYEWAQTAGEAACLYMHTKGVSNTEDPHKIKWRRVMQHYLVVPWQQNLEYLREYDMVGCNWQHNPSFPHYQGNFWMARADWIRKLQHPKKFQAADRGCIFAGQGWNRMFAEVWLGSRQWHHMKSVGAENEAWMGGGLDRHARIVASLERFRGISEYPWSQDPDIPWTLIGKGPSFQALLDNSPPGFRMGLNDVCTEVKVNVVIALDLDTLDFLKKHTHKIPALFLPTRMCHNGRPNDRVALAECSHPVLQELGDRIYVFDWNEGPGSVPANNSTAEAAVELLCRHSQAPCVITAGIDGGTEYHSEFPYAASALKCVQRVAPRASHEWQGHDRALPEIAAKIKSHGKRWIKWDEHASIRTLRESEA